MIRFKTSTRKQVQAAALLARLEGCRIDRIRLLKLLYIADREWLVEQGSPIVGGRVVAMKNGPLHSEVYDLIKGSHSEFEEWSEHFDNDGHVVVLKHDTDRSELSSAEIDKLTEVSNRNRAVDTWALADATHAFPEWQECYSEGTSRTIPLERLLAAVGFTESEIESACQSAEAHRRMERLLCE